MNLPLSLLSICQLKALKSKIYLPKITSIDWKESLHKAVLCKPINGNKGYSIMLAAREGYLDVIQYLHKKGGDLHYNMSAAGTIALVNGHVPVLHYLLNNDKYNEDYRCY